MTGAVERYRTNRPWATPCPITPTFDIQFAGVLSQTVRGCAVSDQSAGTAATGAAPAGAGLDAGGLPGTAATGAGLLGPSQPNIYGPGINSDATGRPFTWQTLPGYGPADPLSPVSPDRYGPGIGADKYGRPVQPVPR